MIICFFEDTKTITTDFKIYLFYVLILILYIQNNVDKHLTKINIGIPLEIFYFSKANLHIINLVF